MIKEQSDLQAAYDTLRSGLITVLMEQHSQDRFARVADGTDQERVIILADLTRSIADILVPAYPKKTSRASAAALADAQTIASAVLERRPLADRRL